MTTSFMNRRWRAGITAALFAMIVGATSYLTVRANRTEKAVAWIQAQELGLVRFDWQDAERGYVPIRDGIHKANWIRRSWGGVEDLTVRDALLTDLAPISNADTVRFANIVTKQELDLTPLAQLRKLERLALTAKHVQSLAPLKELPELKWLLIVDTEIPQSAVTDLQLARPDIQFQSIKSFDSIDKNTEP